MGQSCFQQQAAYSYKQAQVKTLILQLPTTEWYTNMLIIAKPSAAEGLDISQVRVVTNTVQRKMKCWTKTWL